MAVIKIQLLFIVTFVLCLQSCAIPHNAGVANPLKRLPDAVVIQSDVSSEQKKQAWITKGVAVYHDIQKAIDDAPVINERSNKRYQILITAGRYYQRVVVDKNNITIEGQGAHEEPAQTLITYDLYAGKLMPNGLEKYGTFRTATFSITAKNIQLKNLSIENGFDYPANEKLDKTDENKVGGEQAVALKIAGQADKNSFENVSLFGYQDTLYADAGRSYFYRSKIFGHVDFIFGKGNVVFTETDIISRARYKKTKYSGYVTAPSTLITQPYGFTFLNCRLLREPNVPDNSVPLGRPWHPTTTFHDGRYANPNAIGKAVYINTYMDAHISLNGWASMRGTSRVKGQKDEFKPESARFFEYKNSGPGASQNHKRRQLTDQEVAHYYTLEQLLGGWQPSISQE
ncbi:pectinesterase family protein [Catenovulum sediminis]|uniref:Pectinesterase family protein n=1 Tax=Catenovulum sediminis TaxID=1740262 RepID=A0ABV1RLC0_9ALTE|nr:pectinesterase family protein [Catenovulum sediminis]